MVKDKTFCCKMAFVWVVPGPQAGRVCFRDLFPRQSGNNVGLRGQVQRIDRFHQTHGRSTEIG